MNRQAGKVWGRMFIASVLVVTAMILWSRKTALPSETTKSIPESRFTINRSDPGDLRYIAVGDSYTAGTGATPGEAWPVLLTKDLRKKGIPISLVANLAVDGWTTDDAIHNELPVFQQESPTFATLMIGVNDTYRKTTPEEYRTQLTTLMDKMLAVLPNKEHLVVVTIPDYGVTPLGSQYAFQNDAGKKMLLFNAIIKEEAQKRHLPLIDIYPVSQGMSKDRTLIARDGLHPSAKEYQNWEKMMVESIYQLLKVSKKP